MIASAIDSDLGAEVGAAAVEAALIDLAGLQGKVESNYPLYKAVPKGFAANLEYRKRMIRWGSKSKGNAQTLWTACARDLLFYINTFVWTHNPRLTKNSRIPFITYGFQDRALVALEDSVGKEDILIEKSRDMGASWMCLIVFEWMWHFRPYLSFLIGSMNESLVDKSGDPKSLFWKLDFIHDNQPGWLLPNLHRIKLHMRNLDLGGTIDGAPMTEEFARSTRPTSILLDEFAMVEFGQQVLAASRDASDSRIFNSTPRGVGNAFYEQMEKGTPRLRLHWPEHPVKAKGLYHDAAGVPRSPWYDYQCKRASCPMEIAQELDIDYLASDYQFFDGAVIQECLGQAIPPLIRGELNFTPKTFEPQSFTVHHRGNLKLWVNYDNDQEMPQDRDYVVACDVAAGTGASNSVIVVADKKTREKVAEYATPHIQPHKLAQYAIALCRWFKGADTEGAFLIWESNGPGRNFGIQVQESTFRNIYYRRDDMRMSRKSSDFPGWHSSPESKAALLGEYRRALGTRTYLNRSKLALQECNLYVFKSNGQILHAKAATSIDPSGARSNHADRVIADALVVYGMKQSSRADKVPEQIIPEFSPMGLRMAREEKQREGKGWLDG